MLTELSDEHDYMFIGEGRSGWLSQCPYVAGALDARWNVFLVGDVGHNGLTSVAYPAAVDRIIVYNKYNSRGSADDLEHYSATYSVPQYVVDTTRA